MEWYPLFLFRVPLLIKYSWLFLNINELFTITLSFRPCCETSILQEIGIPFQEWKRVSLIGTNGPNNFQGVSPWWTTRPFSRFHRYPNALEEKGRIYIRVESENEVTKERRLFASKRNVARGRIKAEREGKNWPFRSYVMDARVNYDARDILCIYIKIALRRDEVVASIK